MPGCHCELPVVKPYSVALRRRTASEAVRPVVSSNFQRATRFLSHSSGIALWLQSWLVPLLISVASSTPLLLQSTARACGAPAKKPARSAHTQAVRHTAAANPGCGLDPLTGP